MNILKKKKKSFEWFFKIITRFMNNRIKNIFYLFKGELKPEISLLHMKVLTLIKAKSNVFLWYVQCL